MKPVVPTVLLWGVLLAVPVAAQTPGARLFGTDEAPPPGVQPSGPRIVMRLEFLRARGAEACSEQAFRDAVSAQVRRWEPFAPNAPWRLLVNVSRQEKGFEGSVELRDVTGAVALRRAYPPTASCLDLLGDLARAVGIKVDPPAPPGPPGALPAPLPIAPPSDASSPALPPPTKTLAFRLGFGTWMDLATAPRPAFGLSLDVGLRVAWFSVAVEGRVDPPAGGSSMDGVDVSTTRFLGALVPCGHASWFAGCLLGEVGQIRGSMSAPAATPDHQAGLYLAGGARLAAEIPVFRDILFVRLAVDLTGARPAVFRLDGQERWQTAVFTGGLGAGLIASF